MSMPRLALVGAGWVARTVWLPALRDAGADIVTVVDPSAASREAVRAMLPGARLLADWDDDALRGCDAAWICSPNVLHAPQALQALRQGLDVVVEKPVCFSRAEADLLVDAANASGRRLRTTAASSYRGDVRTLADLVDNKALGPLVCVDVSWRRSSGVPRPGSWFTRRATAVGGSGADLGWHLLEVALALLDYPTIESGLWSQEVLQPAGGQVRAAAWRGDATVSDEAVDVDVQTFGCLKTAGGVLVRMSTAWCSHQELDETCVTVYGRHGEATLSTTFGFSDNRRAGSRIEVRRHGQTTPIVPTEEPRDAPYRAFVRAVLADLDTARPPAAAREAAEHRRLRSLGSAMQTIYPSAAAGSPDLNHRSGDAWVREGRGPGEVADPKASNQEHSLV